MAQFASMRVPSLLLLLGMGVAFIMMHLFYTCETTQHQLTPSPRPTSPSTRRKGMFKIPRDMEPLGPPVLDTILRLSGPGTDQEDPELIQLLREELIDTPRPFMTKRSKALYKTPQAEEVDQLLKGKSGGYFVEGGAFDGESLSNTIWLEVTKQWTGFLIEMDPSFYLQVRGKNRKCHTLNACISPEAYPTKLAFQEMRGSNSKLLPDAHNASATNNQESYCFPFFSMMLALNITKIDYFSLDVEGQELNVLKTIPFDKIDISVLSIEYKHGQGPGIQALMEQNGYHLAKTINYRNFKIMQFTFDYIFIKKSLL